MPRLSDELQGFFYSRLLKQENDAESGDGPKAAGIAVKAADTGRVLMLQRSYEDPKDPARGKWEFPGGMLEPGEDAQDAAVREWEEETGQKLPPGRHAGSWTSPNGVYRGHVYMVPHEGHVPVGVLRKGKVINPDDPDHSEALAWFHPKHIQDNPIVRKEVRKTTDWNVLNAKPQASDHEQAQQWNRAAVGPESDISPLHTGPNGENTPKAPGPTPSERFPTGYVTVQPANKKLKVLVADSPARRMLGLQNTPDGLEDHDAMLFRWPADASGAIHNRNVQFPVGATWFDSRGMYVDHAGLLPDDPTAHAPRGPHRYLLEMHQDDHDSLGMGPGSSMDMHQDKNDSVGFN